MISSSPPSQHFHWKKHEEATVRVDPRQPKLLVSLMANEVAGDISHKWEVITETLTFFKAWSNDRHGHNMFAGVLFDYV